MVNLEKRAANIIGNASVERRTAHAITRGIIPMWDLDSMDPGMGVSTMYSLAARDSSDGRAWRIDNQSSGAFMRNGYSYYNVQVQSGSNSYAAVLIPVGYRVGRRRIRNALLQSFNTGEVAVIPVPRDAPRQMLTMDDGSTRHNPEIREPFVQSLAWAVLIGLASIL